MKFNTFDVTEREGDGESPEDREKGRKKMRERKRIAFLTRVVSRSAYYCLASIKHPFYVMARRHLRIAVDSQGVRITLVARARLYSQRCT